MYSEKFLAYYIRNRSLQLINSKWVPSTRIKVFLSFGKSQGLSWHSARSSPHLLLSLLCRISIFRNVISGSNLVAAAPAIRPTFLTARNRTEKGEKKKLVLLLWLIPFVPIIWSGQVIKPHLAKREARTVSCYSKQPRGCTRNSGCFYREERDSHFGVKDLGLCYTHTHTHTVISLILLLRMRFKFLKDETIERKLLSKWSPGDMWMW